MSDDGVTTLGGALSPPPGMRDLLPPESRARRGVSEQIQKVLDGHGYELVTTPLFERVEVFERGSSLDPRDLVRFVEPDGGEVSALRPDMTPQIARVVSSQLANYPAPWRLRYEGTVIRRRRGRARRQRQIAQVGVELVGLPGAHADVEVIRLALEAVKAAGLVESRLELSNVGVARSLLTEFCSRADTRASTPGASLLDQARDPIAQKDEARLLEVLARAGVPKAAQARITRLLALHGDIGVLRDAKKLLKGAKDALAHLAALERVATLLGEHGINGQLGVDLGEIRGASYYTGVSFSMFAHGPGEAVLSGGRYDQLFASYGRDLPATGFAIDLENLLWALDEAGYPWRNRPGARFVVTGQDQLPIAQMSRALRDHGVVFAPLYDAAPEAALKYARAWGYEAVVSARGGAVYAIRASDGKQRKLPLPASGDDITDLCRWAGATRGD